MMERLTFDGNFCDIAQCKEIPCPYNGACSARKVWERLKAYEDTGLTPEEFHAYWVFLEDMIGEQKVSEALDRFRQLVKADKDGRVVVLPCKVGDTVWAILDDKKYACKCMVEFVNIGGLGPTFVLRKVDGLREQYGVTSASFGKTVFLAREEAEKALEAMKDE